MVAGKELLDYWRHARRHYFNLVAGIVLAVLAFASNITGLIVPAWAFWLLAIGFLVVAQFRTYRDLRRELDKLVGQADAIEARRKRLLEDRVLTNETLYVWELLKPGERPLIQNREFIDCTIKGPAIISPQMSVEFEHMRLGSGPVDSVIYDLVPGLRQGLIAIINSKFTRGSMEGIGYYVDKDVRAKLEGSRVI